VFPEAVRESGALGIDQKRQLPERSGKRASPAARAGSNSRTKMIHTPCHGRKPGVAVGQELGGLIRCRGGGLTARNAPKDHMGTGFGACYAVWGLAPPGIWPARTPGRRSGRWPSGLCGNLDWGLPGQDDEDRLVGMPLKCLAQRASFIPAGSGRRCGASSRAPMHQRRKWAVRHRSW
jgi:hypothetical protein